MPYRTFTDKKKEPEKKLRKLKKKKDKLKQKQKQQQKQSVVLNVSAGSSGGGGGFIPQQQAPQIDYSLIANLLRPANTIQQPFRETIAKPEPILPRRAEEPTLKEAKAKPEPKEPGKKGRPPQFTEEQKTALNLEAQAAAEEGRKQAQNEAFEKAMAKAGKKAYEKALKSGGKALESGGDLEEEFIALSGGGSK
jgi:hypothetical protein